VRIRPRRCKLCHFEPTCVSLNLTLLLLTLSSIPKVLSGQPNVLSVIVNQHALTISLESSTFLFIENDSIWISISRREWISLLSVFPHKLVAPLSAIDKKLALSCAGQLKLLVSLAVVHPVNCVLSSRSSLLEND